MGKYITGVCSREELDELLAAVKKDPHSKDLAITLHEYWERSKDEMPVGNVDWDSRFRTMMDQTGTLSDEAAGPRAVPLPRWSFYLAAASILIILACAAWFGYSVSSRGNADRTARKTEGLFKNDVLPGGNKAVLTLANGSSIILDSAQNGTLGVQANTRVLKIANGFLAYESGHKGAGGRQPVYNSIATPRGGQYQVMLPDGTKVWLNASTILRFPTGFIGKERRVELTGEAYFEVTKNASMPFKVSILPAAGTGEKETREVEVLGTSFNVMAYKEEGIMRTTLLDGSVKIKDEKTENVLEPGQQAQSTLSAPGIKVVSDVDVDAVVAWKNGYFNFNKEDIRTVMRQLSRWYDVDVSFSGNVHDRLFWGGIQRNLPLSVVFRILEKSGVQFSIDGKKVVVMM